MSAERRDEAKIEVPSLQDYLCAREGLLNLPHEPRDLFRQIQKRLIDACDARRLAMRPQDIWAALKQEESPVAPPPEHVGIFGGEKDLKRTGERPRFIRHDGAWFTFTMTVRVRRGRPLELVAYDFELCFPRSTVQDVGVPRFVRFDLNPKDHANHDRELRCHMHPGHDDFIVPAPLLGPLELLDLFLRGLALPDRPRRA